MDCVTTAFELMRFELDAAVESLNSDGAKHFQNSEYDLAELLVEKGKKLQSFCERVEELENEWLNNLSSEAPERADDEKVNEQLRTILSTSKSSKTALLIRFPDGKIIAEKKAADSLVAAIRKVGFDRVAALNISVNSENLVSKTPSRRYNESHEPPYYIKTHSSTAAKKKQIEQISDLLHLGLDVEII